MTAGSGACRRGHSETARQSRAHGDGRRSRCCCAGSPGGRRSRSPPRALVFNLFVLPRIGGALSIAPGDQRARHCTASSSTRWRCCCCSSLFPRRPDIAARGVGDPRRRRRHRDARGTRDRRPRVAVEPRQDASAAARRSRSCGAAAGVVRSRGGAGRRSTPPPSLVVHARARRSSPRSLRGARRDDAGPARRQPLGAADGRRRAVARRRWSSIDRQSTAALPIAAARLPRGARAERAGRVRRAIARARCRALGRRRRRGDRHHDLRQRRLAGMDAAARRPSSPRRSRRGSGCSARRCSASPKSAAGGAARATRSPTPALPRSRRSRWRRRPPRRCAAGVRRGAGRRRQRHNRQRNRQGVGHAAPGRSRRWRACAPGTSGAMSLEGTVAGIVGALGARRAGVALGLVPATALLPIVVGATVGALARKLARRHARSVRGS